MKIKNQEFRKSKSNNTDINNTDKSDTDSIYPSYPVILCSQVLKERLRPDGKEQIDEYRRNLELCHEQLSDQDDIGNACDHQPPRYTHCDLVSRRVCRQFRRKKRQRRIGRIGIQQESEGNGTTHKGKRQCDQLRLAAIFPHTRFIPLSAS